MTPYWSHVACLQIHLQCGPRSTLLKQNKPAITRIFFGREKKHAYFTVAHNCHGKIKNLTAKRKTSRQKQKPHGKTKNLTTKPKTSRQKTKYLTGKPILGDPGAVSRVGRKGATKVFKYGRKSPWVPTLTELFPKIQADASS